MLVCGHMIQTEPSVVADQVDEAEADNRVEDQSNQTHHVLGLRC